MAIDFSGLEVDDNGINCGSPSSLDNFFTGGGTFMCWIFPQGWGQNSFGRMGNKTEDGSVGDNGWAFFVTEVNSAFGNAESFTFNHTASPGNGNQLTAAAPSNQLSLNNWHHCVVTFNTDTVSNLPVLYHNGVSVAVSELDTPSGSFDSEATSNMTIGSRGSTLIDREFDGYIEDVRAYNRILTAGEILTIYNSRGNDNIINGLLARWLLNEGADGTSVSTSAGAILDSSGQGNHGTATGSPAPINRGGILTLRRRYL